MSILQWKFLPLWPARKKQAILELRQQLDELILKVDQHFSELQKQAHIHQQEIETLKAKYLKDNLENRQHIEMLQNKVEYYESSGMNSLSARVPPEMVDQVDWEALGIQPPRKR